jgi:hypothetical protein
VNVEISKPEMKAAILCGQDQKGTRCEKKGKKEEINE